MKSPEKVLEFGKKPKSWAKGDDSYNKKLNSKKERINEDIKLLFQLFRDGLTWNAFMEDHGYMLVQYRTVAKEIYDVVQTEIRNKKNREEAESIDSFCF